MSTPTKVIFLDIDGVLLTDTDWLVPVNGMAKVKMRCGDSQARLYLEEVVFSRGAVALVNRLCDETQAQIVLVTSWRRVYEPAFVRKVLERQGIEAHNWHDDYSCEDSRRTYAERGKLSDVREWLSRHPEVERWVVLDDEHVDEGFQHIGINPHDGFAIVPYLVACRVLGVSDAALDSYLEVEDLDALEAAGVDAHGYELARWLYLSRSEPDYATPHELLRRRGYAALNDDSAGMFRKRLRAWLKSRSPAHE